MNALGDVTGFVEYCGGHLFTQLHLPQALQMERQIDRVTIDSCAQDSTSSRSTSERCRVACSRARARANCKEATVAERSSLGIRVRIALGVAVLLVATVVLGCRRALANNPSF